MRFYNPTDLPQRIEIAGRDHVVAPGQGVEIPERLVYIVEKRGMVLRPGEGDGTVARPEAPPIHPVIERVFRLLPVPKEQQQLFRRAWAEADDRERVEMVREAVEEANRAARRSAEEADEDDGGGDELVGGDPRVGAETDEADEADAVDQDEAATSAALDEAAAALGKLPTSRKPARRRGER